MYFKSTCSIKSLKRSKETVYNRKSGKGRLSNLVQHAKLSKHSQTFPKHVLSIYLARLGRVQACISMSESHSEWVMTGFSSIVILLSS